jgi:hypothetical protein
VVAAVEGNHDGVCYNIWAMKDACYVKKIMGMTFCLFFPDVRMHTCHVDGGHMASSCYTSLIISISSSDT